MKYKIVEVNTNDPSIFAQPVKGVVEKHGNDMYITSPNLFDNLIISTGAPFRVAQHST